MHDLLFENQDRLDEELLVELAEQLRFVPAQAESRPWSRRSLSHA